MKNDISLYTTVIYTWSKSYENVRTTNFEQLQLHPFLLEHRHHITDT